MYGLPTTGRIAVTGDSVWIAVIYINGKGRIQPVADKRTGFRWLSGRVSDADWKAWAASHPGVPADKPADDEEALTIRYGVPYQTPEKVFLEEYFFGTNDDGARVMHMLGLDKGGVGVFEDLEQRFASAVAAGQPPQAD